MSGHTQRPASLQTTPGSPETPERLPGTSRALDNQPMDSPSTDREPANAVNPETLRRAEQESAFAGDQREMTGEASTVGQHPADVADFTYQRELQQTTEKFLGRQADQVEAAIRAREKGTYGTCQECGKHIPDERLQARPEATLCVDCQRRLETRQTV